MPETAREYDIVIGTCSDIFTKKMHDYGMAWRILRPTSITDQIFIKANRIRSIEIKGVSKKKGSAKSTKGLSLNLSVSSITPSWG